MTVGTQEVLLYYVSAFVRPPIQTLHRFKLIENTLALPIPNKVKPGKKPIKNNKTKQKIPLKTPTKTKQKKHSETGTNIHNFKWWDMDCMFFFFLCWCFLHSCVETCLKNTIHLCAPIKFECFPPCIAATLDVDKTEDTCCLRMTFLVFCCGDFLVFFFLSEAGVSYIGSYSCILFLFTLLCISGIFFCTAYSEPKKLSIISRKLWHVQNLNLHCRCDRQIVSMWVM